MPETIPASTKTAPPVPDLSITWHTLTAEETLQHLESGAQTGLTSAEATLRQQKYGLNQLVEAPRPTFLKMVLDQLNNFVVILLIVASVVSALLGDWIEAAAIMTIVVLNAILGVVQESKAEEALASLKKLAAPEATVLRNGHRTTVPARDLVPGDIVYLEAGKYIPA